MMPVLDSVALFYTMTNTLLWDLPGDVLATPASALNGWKGGNSLPPSLSIRRLGLPLAPGSGDGAMHALCCTLISFMSDVIVFYYIPIRILHSSVDNAHVWEPSSHRPGRLEQM